MELRKAKLSDRVHRSDQFAGKFSRAAPVPWHWLPTIVQRQILTELSNDYDRDLAKDKKHRAAYAAVCLEWQEFFEASGANFGKLVLHPSALDEFQKIIQRRQKTGEGNLVRPRKKAKVAAAETLPVKRQMLHIRHIWLRIELNEYTCKNCKEGESGKERVGYVFLR